LHLTIEELDEGIAYYYRVSAINAVGQGPYGYAAVPYAIPQAQRPDRPTNAKLINLDGSSLQVAFDAPELDGGKDIGFYRVEYSNSEFVSEVQELNAECNVQHEIQVIKSHTLHTIPEVQLLYIYTSYSGTSHYEIQKVTCDATYGSFRLTFNGYITAPIPYNADTTGIKSALESLDIINSVNVSFTGGISTACFERTSSTSHAGFLVTFRDVVHMKGDLPTMGAITNNLDGLRYVEITENQAGNAPLGGTFRLSFRGSVTEDISIESRDFSSIASDIKTKLGRLDTIPSDGVSVSYKTPANTNAALWAITFVSPELGGDVDAIQIVEYYNHLTGSDVAAYIFADGEESAADRGYTSTPSVAGNELGGQFTLSYRGHTTEPIDFNAADTDIKAKIEALPNIDLVDVLRTGPSVYKEYTWSITFRQMPGAYPAGTGNFVTFVPTYNSTLSGDNSYISVHVNQTGSLPLDGTFALTYTVDPTDSTFNYTEIAANIPADASASELASYLNSLEKVGTVSVSRRNLPNGYQWLITFDGCKIVDGDDVCSHGDIPLLLVNNSLMQCAKAPLSVRQVTRGSGVDRTCTSKADGLCVEYFHNVANPPYSVNLNSLSAGKTYYARVMAHNSVGYSYAVATTPKFAVPTYNPPGPPPPVRLVASTTSSIKVEWDYPRENGGATVQGFQLFVDDWTGGNPRLAFDGIDQPEVTSFNVTTTTSFVIVPNRSYRFTVRAINYCYALEKSKACHSDLSEPAVFIARAPRAPLAPPMPYRHSSSNIGSYLGGDSQITIRWNTVIDDGGSPVTGYALYWASPNMTTYKEIVLSSLPTINTANGHRVFEYTFGGLVEGNVYRFYVVAINKMGRSAGSPVLSVVAGIKPGIDANAKHVYSHIAPSIVGISPSEITVTWPMPPSNSTGAIPITGYMVYTFPGAGANTLANPQTVFNEVQQIVTAVDAKTSTVQKVLVPITASNFSLSAYSYAGRSTLSFASSAAQISAYLVDLLSQESAFSAMRPTVSTWSTANGFKSFVVTFTGYDGVFEPLVLDTLPFNSTGSVLVEVTGTEKIGGSFTLSFNGSMSVDLPYDCSEAEMKSALEDLPGVGIVSVNRTYHYINGLDRNAYKWLVTFDTLAGDLPMLYATPGRLTPLESHVSIAVTEKVKGTPAVLSYNGYHVPEIRTAKIGGLTPGETYAFKVLPINALGEGILSAPTITVYATSGASPAFTTAAGSSLSTGITYDVDEEQTIVAKNCGNTTFKLYFGSKYVNMSLSLTELEMATKIKSIVDVEHVTVIHTKNKNASSTIDYLQLRFLNAGDIATLSAHPFAASCVIKVTEYIKGSRNQFTIEPKSSSGLIVRDVLTASGFEGKDVFLTETWFADNSTWYRDQGVAAYNPQVYEVQEITISSSYLSKSVYVQLNDYLTPYSTQVFNSSVFTGHSTAYEVQQAIQALTNVDKVDVEKMTSSVGDVSFLVTFLTNLCDVPSLQTASNAVITEITMGVCEVQTITIANDEEFIREERVFYVTAKATSLKFNFFGLCHPNDHFASFYL